MLSLFKQNLKAIIIGFILLLIAINSVVWSAVLAAEQQPDLSVSFLDVGQGDSIFIEARDGTQILIDGGPNNQILSRLARLLPYYDRSLDVVVLTHPHADHISGLIDVLKRYDVDTIVESGVLYHTAEAKEFRNLVEEKNIKRIIIDLPTSLLFFDGAELRFLHPDRSYAEQELKKVHNAVLVSMLSYQEKTFLFMSDAEKKLEKALVGRGVLDDINVLKVGHHGSKTSSIASFLRAVSPEFSIISVGRNRYGHPYPDVLSRLASIGAKLLRTDLDGTVRFEINDGNLILKK